MSMNANEIKTTARNLTVNAIMEALTANEAVQFADASYAILQEVDGQEVWTEVTVKSKAYKATKVSPAFDPYISAEAWKEEQRIKQQNKEEKELEKQKKAEKKAHKDT